MIINGVAVYIIFIIIKYFIDEAEIEFNFIPALFWSNIGYFLMKKKCLANPNEDYFDEDEEETDEEPKTKEKYILSNERKDDIQVDIILKMRSNDNFMRTVEMLYKLDDEKLRSINQMLNSLLK